MATRKPPRKNTKKKPAKKKAGALSFRERMVAAKAAKAAGRKKAPKRKPVTKRVAAKRTAPKVVARKPTKSKPRAKKKAPAAPSGGLRFVKNKGSKEDNFTLFDKEGADVGFIAFDDSTEKYQYEVVVGAWDNARSADSLAEAKDTAQKLFKKLKKR